MRFESGGKRRTPNASRGMQRLRRIWRSFWSARHSRALGALAATLRRGFPQREPAENSKEPLFLLKAQEEKAVGRSNGQRHDELTVGHDGRVGHCGPLDG